MPSGQLGGYCSGLRPHNTETVANWDRLYSAVTEGGQLYQMLVLMRLLFYVPNRVSPSPPLWLHHQSPSSGWSLTPLHCEVSVNRVSLQTQDIYRVKFLNFYTNTLSSTVLMSKLKNPTSEWRPVENVKSDSKLWTIAPLVGACGRAVSCQPGHILTDPTYRPSSAITDYWLGQYITPENNSRTIFVHNMDSAIVAALNITFRFWAKESPPSINHSDKDLMTWLCWAELDWWC